MSVGNRVRLLGFWRMVENSFKNLCHHWKQNVWTDNLRHNNSPFERAGILPVNQARLYIQSLPVRQEAIELQQRRSGREDYL